METTMEITDPTPTSSIHPLQARALEACLQGLSAASRTCYAMRIGHWLAWHNARAPGTPFDRETVRTYLRSQELSGASAQVRNQTLAALKRLAYEAGELGWIPPSDAAAIARIKTKKVLGTTTGQWLTAAQVDRILSIPDRATAQGKRDRAVLALLIGCGLRRAEACALETAQLKTVGTEDRMVITNLVGKGGRTRSVAVPEWTAQILTEWLKEISE